MGNGIAVHLTKRQIRECPYVNTHALISRLRKILVLSNAQRFVRGVVPAEKHSSSLTMTNQCSGEPKLLNADAISCYIIDAQDRDIGHVKDLMIDDRTWLIHFILVKTRKWWPGNSMLIGVDHVHDVDEANSRVHLNMVQDGIRNAMQFDPNMPPYLSS